MAKSIIARKLHRPALVLGFAMAAIGGLGILGLAGEAAAQPRRVPQSQAEITLSFAPLVERAAPAVVNILATTFVQRPNKSPLFDDPFFRRFFGDDDRPRRRESEAVGSGVIVGEDGLIVTTHHVIEDADEITVILADRREFIAEIVRDDERTDLAVLKIDVGDEKLPFLPLADSDELEVGELVLAIGNPFGVGQTVTSGIVSALARTNTGISDFNFFVQTDAAINPGNSGGALVRMDGSLAGINTAIFSRSGGSQGVGFAIPANMVRTVIASVGAAGGLQRPWLGADGQSVTSEMAAELKLDRPVGFVIGELYPGGPAERAGVKVGDIIIGLGGRSVDDDVALRFRLATTEVNGTVPLMILRSGRELELDLPVETPPEKPRADLSEFSGNSPFAGATVVNLSPAVADALGVDLFAEGVMIVKVANRSRAARVGLLPLDIIVAVNGVEMERAADLRRALRARPRQWRLSIRRRGRILNVDLPA